MTQATGMKLWPYAKLVGYGCCPWLWDPLDVRLVAQKILGAENFILLVAWLRRFTSAS
ncbi:hypothetical protein AHAS_Ahas14G0187700 [Arachis hypogaea]